MGDFMRKFLVTAFALAAAFSLSSAAQATDPRFLAEMNKDQKGASDFPAAGRYEGSHLLAQTVKAYDELVLPSGPAVSDSTQPSPHFKTTVSNRGRVTRSLYIAPTGRSTLEILANHENALKAAGYQVVYECSAAQCGEEFPSLKYNGQNAESRVAVDKTTQIRGFLIQASLEYVKDARYALFRKPGSGGDGYVGVYTASMTGGSMGDSSSALTGYEGVLIEAVEPKAMEQKIVTISANELDSKMSSEGRVAIYGIFFDFNKADVKPESKAQIDEIAKLLKSNPTLHVLIVGHTDNQGQLAYNQGLSQRRALAVVNMLTKSYAIPAGRMTPVGVGPAAPIASNDTPDGQAKNRRVELVKM